MKFIGNATLLAIALLAFGGQKAIAQLPFDLNLKTPYYIDVDNGDKNIVYEIQDGLLNFQYQDRFGHWKEIILTIYGKNKVVVGEYSLDKVFGLNNYTIDLKSLPAALENDLPYHCVIKDESGANHRWIFKNIAPVRSEDLKADIVVNPKRMSCKALSANLVEFYGRINNGKPPYTIRWYVMNEGKTDLIYQPKEDNMVKRGKTSIIQVDKKPAYYVMMDVTDACGTNIKRMVFLNCQEQKKRVNTIFIEPMKRPISEKAKLLVR